jgi:hypothetical protein
MTEQPETTETALEQIVHLSDELDIDLSSKEINFIGDLQRLTIKPGDIFILQFEKILMQEQRIRAREILEKELHGHKVIVLDAGAKLVVIGFDANETADGSRVE